MNRKMFAVAALLALVAGLAVAQNVTVDYQFNVSRADTQNYFTFAGPIRYMAADKDTFDATSGASVKRSTWLFMPYLMDVTGKTALSGGLRGLFLFAVSNDSLRVADKFEASRANNGVITVQYVHRGNAYRIQTDTNGMITFPNAQIQMRKVGYIVGGGPQVISRDFSSDGTAARIDYAKVWNAGIAAGTRVDASRADVTGAITPDVAVAESLFYYNGSLQVTFDRNILKIGGTLTPVKR